VILTEDEDECGRGGGATSASSESGARLAELLAEDDIEHLAANTEPNRTAGALIVIVPRGRSRA
jgi:hypothetical protein